MKLTIIIPAYCASETIGASLHSIFDPTSAIPSTWQIEVIVVDDGSPDREALHAALLAFPHTIVTHAENRGIVPARNTGIRASSGDIVTILDADDIFVPDWPAVLQEILCDWPQEVNVCLSACRNPKGHLTVSEPHFHGLLTLEDKLKDRCIGEYLPLFRGSYIRKTGYFDTGRRKECGTLCYLLFLEDGPAWVTPRVLRQYDCVPGPRTRKYMSPELAWQIAECYEATFARFDCLYPRVAPRAYRAQILRYAVYLYLAKRPGAWRAWTRGASWRCPGETLGALLMLLCGRPFTRWIVEVGKKSGLIKRYG